jgi:hypothetical protein
MWVMITEQSEMMDQRVLFYSEMELKGETGVAKIIAVVWSLLTEITCSRSSRV